MAFNNRLKEEAKDNLKKAIERYNKKVNRVQYLSGRLLDLRSKECQRVLTLAELYINSLSNTPKYFSREFDYYEASVQSFDQLINDIYEETKGAKAKSNETVDDGIIAGKGADKLLPIAKIAIATAFGPSVAGIAIASLTGAAAKSAAISWLAGGALAGGGLVAGNAILALAGPIGWGFGATGIIGGGILSAVRNKKMAAIYDEHREAVVAATKTLTEATYQITEIINLTEYHIQGAEETLAELKAVAPEDYSDYTDTHKQMLTSFILHIQTLGELMKRRVD